MRRYLLAATQDAITLVRDMTWTATTASLQSDVTFSGTRMPVTLHRAGS